jgi:hypothetical protein
MKHLLVTVLACGLAASSSIASAAAPDRDAFDFKNTIREDGIVFIPFKGVKTGVFWYDEYTQVVTEPAKFRNFERIFVNVTPAASRDGRYASFVHRHGVTDARSVWLGSTGPVCQATAALKMLVADSPYPPADAGPAYPALCMFSIIYPPSMRAKVQALIAAEQAVSVRVNVPLCSETSPSYSSRAVVSALVNGGTLTAADNANTYTGDLYEIVYAVGKEFAAGGAASFSGNARVGTLDFMHKFVENRNTQPALVSIDPDQDPQYVCIEKPLRIAFGGVGGPET